MKIPGKLKWVFFLLVVLTIFNSCHAKAAISVSDKFDHFLNATIQWRTHHRVQAQDSKLELNLPLILAGVLSFVAASVSSAGGIGGGGLFLPILTIVAGLDLKTASTFSAFMVTGGSIANVACNMIIKNGGKTLIDYDIALLSEPCMLLGVSIGVICNVIFPEWLITILFAVFLAWSTFMTFKSGISYWKSESEWMNRNGCQQLENGVIKDENEAPINERGGGKNLEEPLLARVGGLKVDVPWMKLGLLVVIWLCFFVLYIFRGNRYGQVRLLSE